MNTPIFDPATDPETAAKFEQAKQKQSAALPKTLTLRSIKELEDYVPPPDRLIFGNGYLERGSRTTVLGQGGIGKSRLILQAAICCRAGIPFLGWSTEAPHAKWLFIQTENGNTRLRDDLLAMKKAFTEEVWGQIRAGIMFHTIEEEHDGIILLDQPEVYVRVAEAVKGYDPDVLVIDPLRDTHTGDLNSDGDMTEVTRLTVRLSKEGGRTDRALLLLHHALTGRAGAAKATGFDRGSFGRNSKVLQGWTRAQINVAPGDPDNCNYLIVASGKCSNHKEFEPFAIKLDEVTMLYGVDPDFDLETWKEVVAGEKTKKELTEADIVKAILDAGGRVEKNELLSKAKVVFGCGERKVREAIREFLGGQYWEVKAKRNGKPDAVFLEMKPEPRRNKRAPTKTPKIVIVDV